MSATVPTSTNYVMIVTLFKRIEGTDSAVTIFMHSFKTHCYTCFPFLIFNLCKVHCLLVYAFNMLFS